jgi:hypothetical protein
MTATTSSITATTAFSTTAATTALAPVFQTVFSSLLDKARLDDGLLSRVAEYLKKFNLLVVREESQFKAKEVIVDNSRLNDARYRRQVIRQLKAARPSRFTYYDLPVDSARLAMDDYRQALVEFLTTLTCQRLADAGMDQTMVIRTVNADLFFKFLEEKKQFELTPQILADYVLNNMCERLIDNNPRFQEICRTIRATAEDARNVLRAEMAVATEAMTREFDASMAVVLDDIGRQCDAHIAEIHARQAERAEEERRAAAIKAEEDARNFGKSEQQLFAESVRRREREYREANRMTPFWRNVTWLTVIAAAAAIAAFAESDGVTLLEYVGLVG